MRLLLAEDNHKLATALKSGLVAERYAVDVCGDGETAYDFAQGAEYDLLILDRMMPGMDGLEVCRKLRAAGVTTPILFLTAKDAIIDRVTGLDSGADDYLVKPFAFTELLARVRSLLRRRGQKKPWLEHQDLRLDPVSKRVERAGRLLQLTAKEFALLEFLMRHPTQVISSSMLIDHVWDGNYDGFSNIVQTYIKQLRQKIDKPFPEKLPLLKTIRGFGYKLAES